jgi:hypothetical protein
MFHCLSFFQIYLYLVDFLHKNMWYVFDDADLTESGHLENLGAYQKLGFSGGYRGNRFHTVLIGIPELFQTHDALSNYYNIRKSSQLRDVVNGLYRLIVVIADTVHILEWRRCLSC